MSSLIEHSGVVLRTERDKVYVKITSQSGCGSCSAREACGLAESQEKIVEVYTACAADYAADDVVMVGIRTKLGGIAVFVAYILALGVLLVLLFVGVKLLKWNEGPAALLALSGVVAYYGALWIARGTLEEKIQITITKNY